jgi:ABC-type uncharacterized transport system substrate-binding protein
LIGCEKFVVTPGNAGEGRGHRVHQLRVKPYDVPIEQPTTFELVINSRTAKAQGLTISPLRMQRADRLIE